MCVETFIKDGVPVVNRGALILRYKQPAVRWINDADPSSSSDLVTLESVNEERTVYLISDSTGDDSQSLERWLKRHYAQLFEMELKGWYTDPELWPKQRSYELFSRWFEPELHTVLVDLGKGIIFDDGEHYLRRRRIEVTSVVRRKDALP